MQSTQQKLAKIFPEPFQVKRLMKQITDLKDLREKDNYQIKMTLLKAQCFVVKIQLKPNAYKGTKVPQNLRLFQDFRLVLRNNYPAHPPKLYFTHDNMTKLGLKPFCDYLPELLNLIGQWSAKTTITQLIRTIPAFIQKIVTEQIKITSKFIECAQYFEIDTMYSWKFCELHPLRIVKKGQGKQGFLYVNINFGQFVFLEQSGLQSSYMTCDYIRGNEIICLRKKKNTNNHFILELKLSYTKLSGKYAIEFYSQDQQAILMAVMQCIQLSQTSQKQKINESDDDLSQEEESSKKKLKFNNNEVEGTVKQLVEEILVYQSLVDVEMTSANLNQLVSLLKKAIEYFSQRGDERFKIYLNKMQAILSNEIAQALLESSNEVKKQEEAEKNNKNIHTSYQSLIDLLG